MSIITQDNIDEESFSNKLIQLFNKKDDYFKKKENLEKISNQNTWNIVNKNWILINLVSIGLLSSIAIFWGLDRGAYLNFALLLFCIFQVLNKSLKNLFIIILSIFFGWLSFYIIFGHEEFSNFFNNSIWIYSNIEYIYGIIHPSPFGNEVGSSRAGKNLILILLTSFLTISAPSTIAFIFPLATSLGRYFNPQSGAKANFSAGA